MSLKYIKDINLFKKALKYAVEISPLFSESNKIFIVPRFAENLFIKTSGAIDISRSDKVFDAKVLLDGSNSHAGVGVKTFIANNTNGSKLEKIQEFTKISSSGALDKLSDIELAIFIAKARNNSIKKDSKALEIDIKKSIYHCLVRTPKGIFVHEEPYPLINLKSIVVTNKKNQLVTKLNQKTGIIKFNDGVNSYSFSRSKSVLYKKFDFSKYNNSTVFKYEPNDKIWDDIIAKISEDVTAMNEYKKIELLTGKPGESRVVLPMYGMEDGKKMVFPKSGLNQWNAGGRTRKMGETYIPIPSVVRDNTIGFFPPKDVSFNLLLPENHIYSTAKICQSGGKALMTNPNIELCDSLLTLLNPSYLQNALNNKTSVLPITYDDLLRIGYDSVTIVKSKEKDNTYTMYLSEIGTYENFLNELLNRQKLS